MFLLLLMVYGCLLFYFVLNVYLFFERRKYKHLKSPHIPVSPIWFLGMFPEFRRYANTGCSGMVMYEFYRTYGWHLFVVPIVTRNIVYCMDLEIISKISNDRVTFPKNKIYQKTFASIAGVRIFGDHGLLSEPGTDLWYAKRRAMDPAFHKTFLKTSMSGMNIVVGNLIERLGRKRGIFDITEDLTRAALEAVSICGFNWDEKLLAERGDDAIEMASIMFKIVSLRLKEYLTFNLPWNRRSEKRELRENLPVMREVIKEHLKKRIIDQDQKDDILSHIIRSNQCSDQLTLDDLVDEYLVFLGAGMETTAITMAITIFYLTVYPEVYQKVQQEVDQVFGDKIEITFEDVNKLKYLERVIKECLRLKPPVAGTTRRCARDNVVVNRVHIPKEAEIFIAIAALQKDPRFWENPEDFDPERFLPSSVTRIKSYTYMPFMVGQRSCIGKNFAMLEIKTVISRIVREFVVENPNPDIKDIKTTGIVTARPLNGVSVRMSARKFEKSE